MTVATAMLCCTGCGRKSVSEVPTLHPGNASMLDDAPGTPAEFDDRSTSQSGGTVVDRPVALLEDDSITIGTMQERLFERAGAETLRELQLEHALEGALKESSLSIGNDALAHEEHLLLDRLSQDEDSARALLSELRTNQGLGPARYRALLWRNAALRALVQDDIELGEPLLRRLHRLEHGQRIVTRLIIVPTLQEAEELHTRLLAGEAFELLATTRSIDSSRDRGGLIDPLSLEDPAWPAALRTALESAEPDHLTDIIFLDDRFAIARIDSVIPADDITFESNREAMLLLARLTQERLKMADLAGRLGSQPKLRVLDQTLRRAWDIDQAMRRDTP